MTSPQNELPDKAASEWLAASPHPSGLLSRDGRIVAGNRALVDLLGSTEPLLGEETAGAYFGPETDPNEAIRVLAALRTRSAYAGEILCYRRSGGEPFWNDLVLTPWGDGDLSLAICRDVTRRRAAIEALGAPAKHDRRILDRIQAGIIVHNATGEIIYANAKANELIGVTHDGVLGSVPSDPRWGFYAADGRTLSRAEYPVGRAMATKSIVRDLLIGHTRLVDGEVKWVLCNAYPVLDAAGEILEVIVSFTDVTQLTLAERELEKSQERLRLVIEGSQDAPWDWDLETDELYYSPRYLQMVGYGSDDLPHNSALVRTLLHPDDRARVEAEFAEAVASSATTYEIECRMMHKQGTVVHVLSRGFILRDASGKARRVSGTNSDITERRALEDHLRQSQKMEAIGQLAGGVAHDFNNLLAVILGNLELIRAAIKLDAESQESLDDALAAAHRGADLTRRLLAFSREKPVTTSVVSLEALLGNFTQVLRRLIGEQITVVTHVAQGLPAVRVDAGLLENALLNLALNARDAMPKGGTLTIAVQAMRIAAGDHSAGGDLAPGNYVHVLASDTGVGMSRDVAARAMEPFFTTKPIGSGSGLGLSMVYGFARQSGGNVMIVSSPDAGTTVHLYLPVDERVAPDTVALPPRVISDATMHDEVVLVVEDDPSVRRFCLRSLKALGYPTLEAADGKAALALIDSAAKVDLVLTDVVMPNGMSGKELAETLRTRRPGLRLMFMSGYPAQMLDAESESARHRLLKKPFKTEELELALNEILHTDP